MQNTPKATNYDHSNLLKLAFHSSCMGFLGKPREQETSGYFSLLICGF
jgi:hypothetical protein